MNQKVDDIFPLIETAEKARDAAEVAFDEAGKYMDTEAQLEHLSRAGAAFNKAKDYLAMIQADYDDALDMETKATQAVADAKTAAEECEKVDFEEIITSIQKLIDDWSNGEDGTQLEKFIDDLEVPQGHYSPGNQCASNAAYWKFQEADDGSTGFGIVSDCD